MTIIIYNSITNGISIDFIVTLSNLSVTNFPSNCSSDRIADHLDVQALIHKLRLG